VTDRQDQKSAALVLTAETNDCSQKLMTRYQIENKCAIMGPEKSYLDVGLLEGRALIPRMEQPCTGY